MDSNEQIVSLKQAQEKLLRQRFRLLTLIGAIFVPLYSLIDFIYYPYFWHKFLSCRIVAALLCLCLFLADRSRYGGLWIIRAGIVAYYLVGACIVWMIISVNGQGTPYYAGLTLLFVGFCAIVPFKSGRLALHVGSLYLFYLIMVPASGGHEHLKLLVVQNIFLISTVIVMLIAAEHNFKLRMSEYKLREELNKAKDQLKEYVSVLEERVAESEANYATVVNNADEAVFVLENDFITFPNPRTVELFDYNQNSIMQHNFIDFLNDTDKEKVLHAYRRSIEKGESVSIDTVRIGSGDGSKHYVTVTVVPVDWHGNKALLHFIRDITERRKLEAELLQAQKLEAVGTLASGIAHDINNALHIILGYVQILETKDRENYDYLEKISQAAQKATNITRQLLIYGRKAEISTASLDVNEHIMSVCRLLERTIPRMISIDMHLQGEIRKINAVPIRFEQVIINLAINARDAMPQGGTLRIETCNMDFNRESSKFPGLLPGSYVLIKVADTGCGMDEVTRSRIFDPFFTTKDKGSGTGLGLAIAYGIIKQHNGFIYCSSTINQGTSFFIFLPVAEKNIKPHTIEENGNIPAGMTGNGETVLVVDDEHDILEIEKNMLISCNYRVVTASSGEDALDLFKARGDEIKVVILDLNMPGMGGFRCLQELKRLSPDVKVIIATGYTGDAHIKDVINAGIADIVHKPFRINEILSRIHKICMLSSAAANEIGEEGKSVT